MNRIINSIPIFPLSGVILLPNGNLPLNIFEPRYIAMIDYALKKDKIIGMIQPKKNTKNLFKMGCVGKITSFSETNDNRYLINLCGLTRFTILNEKKNKDQFRVFEVEYEELKKNFNKFDKKLFNKNLFAKKIKLYFEKNGLVLDFNSINKIDDKSLIKMIAMICPFGVNEKQMLLEAQDINNLLKILEALLDFSINKKFENDSIN